MKHKVFLSLFYLFLCHAIFAQAGGGIFPPGIFGPPVRNDVQVDLGIREDTKEDDDLFYKTRSASLIYMPKENNWFASANYQETNISDTSVTLEDGVQVKGSLKNQQVTVGRTWGKGEDSTWSLLGGIGSVSDRPFKDSGDNTYRLSLINIRKQSASSSWILGAFFNNNLNVGVPILPVVAYSTRLTEWANLTVGMPFLNLYLGKRGTTGMNILLTPGNARALVIQPIIGPVAVRAGFSWEAESFQHFNRLDKEDQFFIERQSFFVGGRLPLMKGLLLSFNIGKRVNTRYFQAEGVFDDANRKFDLPSSEYIEALFFIRI